MSENAGSFASRIVKKNDANGNENYDLFADKRKTRGQKIMELAEILLPKLRERLADVRDPEGLLLHPSRLRAVAIQVSQRLVVAHEAA